MRTAQVQAVVHGGFGSERTGVTDKTISCVYCIDELGIRVNQTANAQQKRRCTENLEGIVD